MNQYSTEFKNKDTFINSIFTVNQSATILIKSCLNEDEYFIRDGFCVKHKNLLLQNGKYVQSIKFPLTNSNSHIVDSSK